jgi:hypothetical protein
VLIRSRQTISFEAARFCNYCKYFSFMDFLLIRSKNSGKGDVRRREHVVDWKDGHPIPNQVRLDRYNASFFIYVQRMS